jgi:hypothetical protein
MQHKRKLVCASFALAVSVAQALPMTVDVGSFSATYDVDRFEASWQALIYEGAIAEWTLQPAQYQVTTGADSFRVQFIEDPNLPPGPSPANTLLRIGAGGDNFGSGSLDLPLTLQAPTGTRFTVSMGLDYIGSGYGPPPVNVSPNPIPSTFAGTLSVTTGGQSVPLIPFKFTVPPEGQSLTSVVLSGELPEAASLTSIVGDFSAHQGEHRGTAPTILGTIRYVEVEAVSAVPEPSIALMFAIGLLSLWRIQKRFARS